MKKKIARVAWTEREDAIICRMRARGLDFDDIAKKLPNRTLFAVQRRVAHLVGQGRIASWRARWSEEENSLLCKLQAQGLQASAMKPHFKDRTRSAIVHQLRLLEREGRIQAERSDSPIGPAWTDREEAVLVQMRKDGATLDEIAAKLKRRTRSAVAAKAQALIDAEELPRAAFAPLSKRPWTLEEDELVVEMRKAGKSATAMAAALGRSVASVVSRIAVRVRKNELELLRQSP